MRTRAAPGRLGPNARPARAPPDRTLGDLRPLPRRCAAASLEGVYGWELFAFSASSSRSRRTSDTEAPPYLLRHLKKVALLTPCCPTGPPPAHRSPRL